MNLLAIDTASARCSAALLLDGRVAAQSVATARDHARLILPMIDGLLRENDLELRQLQALAFGRGPGSFTGLRIAAGVAQGLALGAGLGVVPVSDLRALAEQALRVGGRPTSIRRVLACMDARMSEVYWACFAAAEGELLDEQPVETVGAPEDVRCGAGEGDLAGIGLGLAAWPALPRRLGLGAGRCLDAAEPDAIDILHLAARDMDRGFIPLPPEAAQPVYLRNQVARLP